MSNTKDVYVIKVKTKPPLSSLYPSERRYSASTIGGLSMVHFGLGILAFVLSALSRSLQGVVLSFVCLVPFATGLLAWRRWYIDKNISFFFYGSLLSLTVSILCLVATAFDIAAMAETGMRTAWRLENLFAYADQMSDRNLVGIFENDPIGKDALLQRLYSRDAESSGGGSESHDLLGTMNATAMRNDESAEIGPGSLQISRESEENPSSTRQRVVGDAYRADELKSGFLSFWRVDPSYATRTTLLLDINILVTCLLEISWSMLSLKLSLRGMRNQVPESSYQNNTNPAQVEAYEEARTKVMHPRPDLVSCDAMYDENLPNSPYLSIAENSGPRLPLPESKKEFRERVERFLTHQAAHRIVEGSCS